MTNPIPEPKSQLNGLRVLVVDDDANSLWFLQVLLEIYGVEVAAAQSVSQAIALFSQFSADILITDIAMPDEDGFSFLRRVRSLVPQGKPVPAFSAKRNCKATALTAYAEKEICERAMRAGFVGYITKPFDPDGLIDVLTSLVSQNRCFA